jgi:peptidoglycan/LPS O-acetylase OafA/YrhL
MNTLPKHMPALDGLRGVAILLVILTHVSTGWLSASAIYSDPGPLPETFMMPTWLLKIAHAGDLGVVLFFVVSAFTLTVRSTQWREDLAGYALRRVTRVGPGYWLAGIGYTLFAGLAPRMFAPNGISGIDFVVSALFGTSLHGGPAFAVVPGGWSVSVEICFYIALPAALRFIDGQIHRALSATLIIMVLTEAWSVYVKHVYGWSFFIYANPIDHAPVFLVGITAALIASRGRLPNRPILAVGCLAFAIFALPLLHIPGLLPQLPFAALVAISVALSARHAPRVLANRLLCHIGEVSYSMYLVHFAVLPASLHLSQWAFPASDWRTMFLHYGTSVAVSFAIACVTYKYIEQPPIRFVSRLLHRRRSAMLHGSAT